MAVFVKLFAAIHRWCEEVVIFHWRVVPGGRVGFTISTNLFGRSCRVPKSRLAGLCWFSGGRRNSGCSCTWSACWGSGGRCHWSLCHTLIIHPANLTTLCPICVEGCYPRWSACVNSGTHSRTWDWVVLHDSSGSCWRSSGGRFFVFLMFHQVHRSFCHAFIEHPPSFTALRPISVERCDPRWGAGIHDGTHSITEFRIKMNNGSCAACWGRLRWRCCGFFLRQTCSRGLPTIWPFTAFT